MNKFNTSFLIAFTLSMYALATTAQIISFPDVNLKNALISDNNCSPGIDKNKNGEIENSEAATVQSLCLDYKGIKDLSGIEYFTSLVELNCEKNLLKNIDIAKLPMLRSLFIADNQIDTLTLKSNSLEELNCRRNKLTQLGLDDCSSLGVLVCSHNFLESLSLNHNNKLFILQCDSNQLTSLDISHTQLQDSPTGPSLYSIHNPDLATICINESQTNITSWKKDPFTSYSTSCGAVTGTGENIIHEQKTILSIYTAFGQIISKENAVHGLFIHKYTDGTVQKVWE